jgi:elongation factor G
MRVLSRSSLFHQYYTKEGDVKKYDTQHIRNIALIGSKGVGKTTFVEATLFVSKATGRMGRVDEGNSIIDYDHIEVDRKQSISSKVIPVEWKQNKINIIDTPGYADFVGDAVGGISAADVTVVVVDAASGVAVPILRLANMAKEMGRPTVFFINKMDTDRADVEASLGSIKEKIASGAALFQLPIGVGADYQGVVDLLGMKAYTGEPGKITVGDVPADLADKSNELRGALMEAVAESSEELLEKYLESGELSDDDMKKGIARGIAKGQLSPVFVGSAYTALGIESFLNFMIDYFPAPDAMGSVKAKKADGTEVELSMDPNGPLAARVFKLTSDPGIGDVFFFKVYSGTINTGDDVFNMTHNAAERMGHLISTRGKEKQDVDAVVAGDIAAVAKLKHTHVNDTISTKSDGIVMDPIVFPKSVVPVAVHPKTKKDQDKLGLGLSKLTEIDPTFTYHIDKEFSETIVTAMGDVQIDVMVKRLGERYGVEVELGKPHIPYREKITKASAKQGKHKKQSGGHGQYGDCWLRVEPQESGKGFEFVSEIVGGSIPTKYIPAVEKGVRDAMKKGTLAGYKVVDIKVTVYDGSYHDVDSSDMAFQIAGAMAFKSAMVDAVPQLIEPIVDLEVYAPQDYMGDLSSDISQRRGRVSGMAAGVISAKVPMSELYQYSASLKSITSGAGDYSMSFSHYETVPAHISQKVIEETAKETEEKKS